MLLNFPYFIETLPLSNSKGIFPLFEAISNSMDSINEMGQAFTNGKIVVELERANQLTDELSEDAPISNIIITDNGIGFVEKNYSAFSEFATNRKKDSGGKGLGRLSWLKAFDYAKIDSFFIENDNFNHLEFEFRNAHLPIQNINRNIISEISENTTKISLFNFKEEYEKSVPKKIESIGMLIITHFLPYFMMSTIPEIILQEKLVSGESKQIEVGQLFADEFIKGNQKDQFEIFGKTFDVVHLKTKFKSHGNKQHKVFFIGNGRVVKEQNISSKEISNIPEKIIDPESDGNEYVYNGYVESDYFNQNINQSRDSFIIDEFSNNGLFRLPTWAEINQEVYASIEKYLSSAISSTKTEKYRKIEDFIRSKAPEYSYIFIKHQNELDSISLSDIAKNRIGDELYRIHTKLKAALREEANNLLSIPKGEISPADYQEKMNELIDNLNPNGRAELVNYIIFRKIVIDLLKKGLAITDAEKFKKEEIIHGYFFPLKKTSEEISVENHNLWLIDERLSYNSYIASDRPLSSISGLEEITEGKSLRPDIFSAAFATGENGEFKTLYNSLDIVEFKRPMRNDYTVSENPLQQIDDYLGIIRSNKAKTDSQRNFGVMDNGVIYCHIICDITDKLKHFLTQKMYKQVGNLNWYILFHPNYSAFIEVKSFDFVLENAYYRNKILFDKLGIQL